MAGDWINIELKMPRLKDPSDRREMAKFIASLVSKFEDVYTYASGGTAIWDTDEDTGIQVEETPDEDKIRFDTAGSERMVIDDTGDLYMTSGKKICLDGSTKNFYWKYNSSTDYLEGYVDGGLRIQL